MQYCVVDGHGANPNSVPGNWAAEVRKWLGDQRLRTMVLAPGANAAQQASAPLDGADT